MTKIDEITNLIQIYDSDYLRDGSNQDLQLDKLRIRATKLIESIKEICNEGFVVELLDDIQLHIANGKTFEFRKRKWQIWMKYDGIWCLREIYQDYYEEFPNVTDAIRKLQDLTTEYLKV